MKTLSAQFRTHPIVNVFLSCVVASFAGCSESRETSDPQYGTESHFLVECSSDADCGEELECLGGRCSIECEVDADCEELHEQAVCGETPEESGRSCDVACEEAEDCSGLATDECTSRCQETLDPAPEPEGEVNPEIRDASASPAPEPSTPPATEEPEAPPTSTEPEPTAPGLTPSSSVVDAGGGSSDAAPAQTNSDAGPPSDSGAPTSTSEPASTACTTSADCLLATRIDVCCPDCEQAYSATSVLSDECLYASGEPATTSCTPSDCPGGCPGAACAETVGAVCVGGECRVSVALDLCAPSTCDAGENCVDFEGSYACLSEDCTYDSCHPERCDQVGEPCCDPFPRDGVNYCNEGLECGSTGCAAPEGVDPERLCNNVLCPEGQVCCDKCLGTCVDALSGANCPNDNSSATVCDDASAP